MDARGLAPRLLRQTLWTWRWVLNIDRALPHRLFDRPELSGAGDLAELRRDGILIRPAEHFFGGEAQKQLAAATKLVEQEVAKADGQAFLAGQRRQASKGYRMQLLGHEWEPSSPLLAMAIHAPLLGLVNSYLGMRGRLQGIQGWLDVPTGGAPTETQLWHRDDDDISNLKVFVYLNEVSRANGPFCYIPGTHPGGRRAMPPAWAGRERISDAEMAAVVPQEEWRICTAPPVTVVIADTCGYHKGLQPQAGQRLLLAWQYTSGRPKSQRRLKLTRPAPLTLPAPQRWALAG